MTRFVNDDQRNRMKVQRTSGKREDMQIKAGSGKRAGSL